MSRFPGWMTGRTARRSGWAAAAAGIGLTAGLGSQPWLSAAGDAVVIPAGFWAGVAFITYYTLLARWWRNPFGQMIVALDFAVVLVTGPVTIEEEFGVVFAMGLALRLLFAALAIVPVTIVSRTLLLGALHGWAPRQPWKHKADDAPDE